jgi:mycothiol synthase
LYDLLIAVDQADDRGGADTLDEMASNFDDPWTTPETDTLAAVANDGQIAALAWTYVNPQPEGEVHAFLWGEVHPEHRGRGLGHAVLSWMEARVRQRLQSAPAHLPRDIRVACPDHLPDRVRLIERHGFTPIRHYYRMRRDLSLPIPEVEFPDGIRLRTYDPDLDEATFHAYNESFSDHWSFEPATPEDWQLLFVGRETFRPELTFIATDGDDVAGFSLNRVNPEDNARQGIQEGWVGQLGVRRAWRKRGIASALLCESMRAFKAAGLDYAVLGVDSENPTGALGLYERVGFAIVKRFILFSKSV